MLLQRPLIPSSRTRASTRMPDPSALRPCLRLAVAHPALALCERRSTRVAGAPARPAAERAAAERAHRVLRRLHDQPRLRAAAGAARSRSIRMPLLPTPRHPPLEGREAARRLPSGMLGTSSSDLLNCACTVPDPPSLSCAKSVA
eukprot:6175904-Pleurochrysis_carterae.AAC.1